MTHSPVRLSRSVEGSTSNAGGVSAEADEGAVPSAPCIGPEHDSRRDGTLTGHSRLSIFFRTGVRPTEQNTVGRARLSC